MQIWDSNEWKEWGRAPYISSYGQYILCALLGIFMLISFYDRKDSSAAEKTGITTVFFTCWIMPIRFIKWRVELKQVNVSGGRQLTARETDVSAAALDDAMM